MAPVIASMRRRYESLEERRATGAPDALSARTMPFVMPCPSPLGEAFFAIRRPGRSADVGIDDS